MPRCGCTADTQVVPGAGMTKPGMTVLLGFVGSPTRNGAKVVEGRRSSQNRVWKDMETRGKKLGRGPWWLRVVPAPTCILLKL